MLVFDDGTRKEYHWKPEGMLKGKKRNLQHSFRVSVLFSDKRDTTEKYHMLARLDHVQLASEAPERLAAFYHDAMGMAIEEIDRDLWLCQGPQRCLLVGKGAANTLGFAAYRCESMDDLLALWSRLSQRGVSLEPSPSPLFSTSAFSFLDPDGNRMAFGFAEQQSGRDNAALSLKGRLQHISLTSANTESMVRFYSEIVGLAITDKVLDGDEMSACFMLADEDREHHTLAINRAAKRGFDHYAYEVEEWSLIRDWADYLASKGVQFFWGPGRHGPGNNLFVFVLDLDGNKIELSAELEMVDTTQPAGIWRHEPVTFNRWGPAFMRS
jgi:catechol 2,3-dioxygenase